MGLCKYWRFWDEVAEAGQDVRELMEAYHPSPEVYHSRTYFLSRVAVVAFMRAVQLAS